MDFSTRYAKLNSAQREAVDTIDGPVMVIAGPGTGKTELLSMRTANILRKTDELPENILCLTFTESGSIAMQKRLRDVIGRDAYNVSIYTFHAFGAEVMSRYREYFYNGANFRPADALTVHHILTTILDELPYDNPLLSRMNGNYTALGDITSSISDLKRAGMSVREFTALLDAVDTTLEQLQDTITAIFSQRISKSTYDQLIEIIPTIKSIEENMPLDTLQPFSEVLLESLVHALEEAATHPKTTPPLTAWKRAWLTQDAQGNQVLRATKYQPKLRALAAIYERYLEAMQTAELIDFDDMIMQVVHALETHSELRYELQEKYHYIMVDEFQDTNLSQMRILRSLTNNPVVEESPNILVVGDDDQAIYGFQGAEVGNILTFNQLYPSVRRITLRDNYRSVAPILTGARDVITQADERLERLLEGVDKTLTAHMESPDTAAQVIELPNSHAERAWIAHTIAEHISQGVAPASIAVIAKTHKDLVALLEYMVQKNIPVSYDRRDNVLDDEVIIQLEHVGHVIWALFRGDHPAANAHLPEMLSHPAWNIAPETLWDISLNASSNRQTWLETMRHHDATSELWAWLQSCAKELTHTPLERMLDILLGTTKLDGEYTSPLREYFFPAHEFEHDASRYLMHLENLTAIRTQLRQHQAALESARLPEFLEFIEQHRTTDTRITSLRHVGQDDEAVQLLTAHGSKGLEYDHVFIVNATDSVWGKKASGRSATIQYPPHLRLARNSGNYDERLRLFFVAMTRARTHLHISYARENDSAKETLPAGFLVDSQLTSVQSDDPHAHTTPLEAAERIWYAPIVSLPTHSMQDLLAPLLAQYKISATHVNAFIDVSQGGPQTFLLNNLLRFPSSPSPHANYGTAIHATLQRAHDYIRAHKSPQPEEDILHEFEKSLEQMPFTPEELPTYLQKGSDALRAFLNQHYASFSPEQHAELNFSYQDVWLEEAHLTGKLDVVMFDTQAMTATVTDYKTGGSLKDWDKGPDYQKIKAHKYRQQLLFYKLLIEHSREWRKYTMTRGVLQFVEPDKAGNIVALELSDIDTDELARFAQLVQAVWHRIQTLDFPDTSRYDATLAGIKQFEEDLLTDTI